MTDVKAEGLVDALAEIVKDKQAETLNERPVKVKAKALVNAHVDTLAKEEPKPVSNTDRSGGGGTRRQSGLRT